MKTGFMKAALQEMRNRFSRIDCALFTTYTFNPPFFENNVLPILVGQEPEGRHVLRPQLNRWLREHPVAVFYDENTRPQLKNGYRYAQVPVYLQSCFHPKISLLAGTDVQDQKPLAAISVASGNLTMAGWSRNRETVSWTTLSGTNAALAQEFVGWLDQYWQTRISDLVGKELLREDHGGTATSVLSTLDGILETCKEAPMAPEDPELWLNWPGRERQSFLGSPATGKWDTLAIMSPYWTATADVYSYLQGLCSALILLPSKNIRNGKFVVANAASPHLWQKEAARIDAADRFSHAKVYLARRGDEMLLCVGSANATIPGLGLADPFLSKERDKNNAEAMLIYRGRELGGFGECEPIGSGLIDSGQSAGESEPIERIPFRIDIASRMEERRQVVLFRIAEIKPGVLLRMLVVGRRSLDLSGNTQSGEIQISPTYRAENRFRIRFEAGGQPQVYCGPLPVFGATDSQLGYRTLTNLDSLLRLMMTADVGEPGHGDEPTDGYVDPDDIREFSEESVGDAVPEPDYDYFRLFRGFFRYRKRISEKPLRAGESSTISLSYLVEHARNLGTANLEPLLYRYCMMVQIAELPNLRGVRSAIGETTYEGIQAELKETEKIVLAILNEKHASSSGFPKARRFLRWFRSEMALAWEREYG